MNDNNEGPERHVQWADTETFRAVFGDEEADKQRELFDRASWAKPKHVPITPSPELPDDRIMLTRDAAGKLLLLWGASVGVAVLVALYFCRK